MTRAASRHTVAVMTKPARNMNPEGAETLALTALAFLAQSPDDMGRFLTQSGLDAAMLRARASDPDLLVSILDHLLANEPILVAFCEAEGMDARDVHRARHVLGGV